MSGVSKGKFVAGLRSLLPYVSLPHAVLAGVDHIDVALASTRHRKLNLFRAVALTVCQIAPSSSLSFSVSYNTFKAGHTLYQKTTSYLVEHDFIRADPDNQRPHSTNDFAGVPEIFNYGDPVTTPERWSKYYQARFIRNSQELDQALIDCQNNSPTCDPNIKSFARMLDEVRQISDQATQIMAVNAWVNLWINYDFKEAETHAEHRSLKQAIIDRQGVCDEQAQLKTFAIEKLGFSDDQVRWVGLDYYMNAKHEKDGHAFTVVKIGQTNWVLNNQSPIWEGESLNNYRNALTAISYSSLMETAEAATNIAETSFLYDKGQTFIPLYAFNRTKRLTYVPKMPPENLKDVLLPADASRATGENISLFGTNARETGLVIDADQRTNLLKTMLPAMEGHYELGEVKAKLAMIDGIETKPTAPDHGKPSPARRALGATLHQ